MNSDPGAANEMKDSDISQLIKAEEARQKSTLMLIPSENFASDDVMEAVGSVLGNKYSEGYAGKRYYQGNAIVDDVEQLAIERAKELFGVLYVNVQPYSGSPANAAVYFALLEPGDTIMGLKLSAGGHLTHGHPDINFSGKFYTSVQYDVDTHGHIDMKAARTLAQKHKPKIITVGTTAYPREFDWKMWREIADEVGAYLLADISHIAGLVAGGAHSSPVPYADVIMTTTHKTLRGPRGAMIMVTDCGIKKAPDMGKKIDRAVFPGLQGGPHENTIAGIAVALQEAQQPEFKEYAENVMKNARTLAAELSECGFKLVTDGTDNHMIVIDLQPQGLSGNIVAEALEVAGIIVNRNSIPHDPNPPFYPSGIRLGTPAVTTQGMGAKEMKKIAGWIAEVIDTISGYTLPANKEKRGPFMQDFRDEMRANKKLSKIAREVAELCEKYPTP